MPDLSQNAAYQELVEKYHTAVNNMESARAEGVEPNPEDLLGSVLFYALAKCAEAILEGQEG